MNTTWFDKLPAWLRRLIAGALPTCTLWEYDLLRMNYRFRPCPRFCITARQQLRDRFAARLVCGHQCTYLRRMPVVFKEIVEVPHGSTTRAVEATISVPPGVSVNNLQELAERAYRAASKQITVDGVTVKVRILGGR